MFTKVTDYVTGDTLAINVENITTIMPAEDNEGTEITFYESMNFLVVRETVEELYMILPSIRTSANH